ncbi:amidohydrolase [Siculibacillus lacustris]|uniref:Amidohydrolase n=1 Tax=Siculibacillus lacustris TaxID=1549641 RepID=A0A4V6MZ54_9HYPH|nr:amidohydrolase family protein [Siculibacillus lacustris]TBW40658.1 amidohydrolase [Siculibacillus lacustris]
MATPIVDAHHHFWDPEDGDYGWLSGPYAPIRRVFGPEDLRPELAAAGITATVLVQTWGSVAETRRFLALTETVDFVAGVVGWVDLTAPDVATVIADLKACPGGDRLVGIRHQVHDEPDPDWLGRPDVRRGLAAVAGHGLVYDLLLRPRELPAALAAVAALPDLRFVIDHFAKPDVRGGGFAAWAALMAPFADHRDHVACKLSGLVTEADWETWSPADLAPYVAEALRLFGPERCLYGSDWPVCRVAGGYRRWFDALGVCLDSLAPADRARVLGGTAVDVYRLNLTEPSA